MWERLYNPDFDQASYEVIFNEAGLNRFMLSVKKWLEQTKAIGIQGSAGRYGGTYAHKDIALEFCSWLSPLFKLYVIREFDRLKHEEFDRLAIEWDVRRLLSKVNYHLHTDAVRTNLVPLIDWHSRRESFYFASEADVLNVAVFGMTAQQWKLANPEAKGNMRDHASPEQLIILANLEAINAELLREGLSQDKRAAKLNEIAVCLSNANPDEPADFEGIAGEERVGEGYPRNRRFKQVNREFKPVSSDRFKLASYGVLWV